ncbi:MAG: hypothetical protein QNJ98_19505 [Planctomycetota bacterium]|nr:hypothetical protein [Planctomycetota bacterium]
MRTRSRIGWPLLLVSSLLLAAATADAAGHALDDWLRQDSAWKDFGVGTMTHMRKTTTMDVPGAEGRKVVFEEKRTLTAKSDTTATIRVERRVSPAAKRWEQRDITETLAGAAVGKAEIVRDANKRAVVENIRIGDKDYACTKYAGTRPAGADKTEQGTLWVHEDLGVLKYSGGVGPGPRMTWTVIRLAVTRKVGDQTIECRQLLVQGREVTGTMLVSPTVPGFVVEETLTVDKGPVKSKTQRVLIGFIKK